MFKSCERQIFAGFRFLIEIPSTETIFKDYKNVANLDISHGNVLPMRTFEVMEHIYDIIEILQEICAKLNSYFGKKVQCIKLITLIKEDNYENLNFLFKLFTVPKLYVRIVFETSSKNKFFRFIFLHKAVFLKKPTNLISITPPSGHFHHPDSFHLPDRSTVLSHQQHSPRISIHKVCNRHRSQLQFNFDAHSRALDNFHKRPSGQRHVVGVD